MGGLYDGGGTVRQLTDSAGAVTDTYDYDAFGNLVSQTGTTPNNYLYRGEQWDPDLSLYYLRARYYNPVTDRFVSRDPDPGRIAIPQTLHKYLYAGADGVNRIDPTGRADFVENAINLAKNAASAPGELVPMARHVICFLNTATDVYAAYEAAIALRDAINSQSTLSELASGVAMAASIASVVGDVETCSAQAQVKEESGPSIPGTCPLCFAAGTPVHTNHGEVPIEKIVEGDEVEARNSETGTVDIERVTELIPPHKGILLEVRIEGERAPLRPSLAHPFWVKRGDSEPDWIPADHMRIGDLVQSLQGAWRRVVSITQVEGQETVYNFTVDKDHDYFVGETGFLVHNAGGCGCGPGSPLNWGDRIKHVMRHANDIPTRKIMHGVFADNPIDMVNQAWAIAGAAGLTPTVGGNGNWNYSVPFPEAGLGGGMPGAAAGNPVLDTIHIVTKPGCNDIVTAFPE